MGNVEKCKKTKQNANSETAKYLPRGEGPGKKRRKVLSRQKGGQGLL